MQVQQLDQILALPLQSAIRAQNLAIQETISLIEQFGTEDGKAKPFRITAERLVEERVVDEKTGNTETKLKVQPFEINIPLIALLPPANINIKEMDVEFSLEIVEPRSEPIKSYIIPSKAIGTSLASSLALLTSPEKSNPNSMKVNLKIVREIPEGMARLTDVLTSLMSGQKVQEEEKPPKEDSQPKATILVNSISGINLEAVNILKERGIVTIKDFIDATKTKDDAAKIAKRLGVSQKTVNSWRKIALLMVEGKP